MQNALVSMISGAVVRTTHLTGMFTDLGIDLASLLTSEKDHWKIARSPIILRLTIISFFLLGGIVGGLCFAKTGFTSFFLPAGLLLIALFYDYFRLKLLLAIRKQ